MAATPEDVRMSLGEHLEELRTRLFLGLIGPVVIMAVLLFFAADIVQFLAVPVIAALAANNAEPVLRANDVGEAFGAYIRVAFIGGLILGIPWLFYQLWRFVAPGLYASERRFVTSLIPGSVVLAILGLTFMYYVMLPLAVWFLVGFGPEMFQKSPDMSSTDTVIGTSNRQVIAMTPDGLPLPQIPVLQANPADAAAGQIWFKVPENELRVAAGEGKFFLLHLKAPNRLVEPLITLGSYISFVMWLALATAVAFQLPLVMLMLAWAMIVDYKLLRRGWRWAIMLSVVAGAALSPGGDIFTMAAFTVPLYFLYEFGLLLVKWFAKNRGPAVFSGAADEDEEPPSDTTND